MTKVERVKYEMLLRVRDFGAAHSELFPETSKGGKAFAQVAQAAADVEVHDTAKPLTAKEGREAMAVARATILEQMRIIARTGRGLRKGGGPAGRILLLPGRVSDVALLSTARGFVREAGKHQAQLTELGLPEPCVATLRQAVTDLVTAHGARRDGRAGVAKSQAGLSKALAVGLAAVRTLDIVVPNAVEQDAVVSAEWRRQRAVIGARAKRRTDEVEVMDKAS